MITDAYLRILFELAKNLESDKLVPAKWKAVEHGYSIKSHALPGVCSGISPKTFIANYLVAVQPHNVLELIEYIRNLETENMALVFDKRIATDLLDKYLRENKLGEKK